MTDVSKVVKFWDGQKWRFCPKCQSMAFEFAEAYAASSRAPEGAAGKCERLSPNHLGVHQRMTLCEDWQPIRAHAHSEGAPSGEALENRLRAILNRPDTSFLDDLHEAVRIGAEIAHSEGVDGWVRVEDAAKPPDGIAIDLYVPIWAGRAKYEPGEAVCVGEYIAAMKVFRPRGSHGFEDKVTNWRYRPAPPKESTR